MSQSFTLSKRKTIAIHFKNRANWVGRFFLRQEETEILIVPRNDCKHNLPVVAVALFPILLLKYPQHYVQTPQQRPQMELTHVSCLGQKRFTSRRGISKSHGFSAAFQSMQ
jgi:hypothetical protein